MSKFITDTVAVTIATPVLDTLEMLHTRYPNHEFMSYFLTDEAGVVIDMFIPEQVTTKVEAKEDVTDGLHMLHNHNAFKSTIDNGGMIYRQHSHNTMGVTPSGIDVDTAWEDKRLSFITNNRFDISCYTYDPSDTSSMPRKIITVTPMITGLARELSECPILSQCLNRLNDPNKSLLITTSGPSYDFTDEQLGEVSQWLEIEDEMSMVLSEDTYIERIGYATILFNDNIGYTLNKHIEDINRHGIFYLNNALEDLLENNDEVSLALYLDEVEA